MHVAACPPQGHLPKETNVTCTACAGTLLLEFGLLSRLTGKPVYMRAAEHAARAMFERRSRLGLVGASMDVQSSAWVHKEATIGPGIDSYYEYLLKVRACGRVGAPVRACGCVWVGEGG